MLLITNSRLLGVLSIYIVDHQIKAGFSVDVLPIIDPLYSFQVSFFVGRKLILF